MLLQERAKAQLQIRNGLVEGLHFTAISDEVICVATEHHSISLAEITGLILFTTTF